MFNSHRNRRRSQARQGYRPSTSIRKLRPERTVNGWLDLTVVCCQKLRLPAWKNSFPVHVPWRSPRSTNSRSCSATNGATSEFDHIIFDTAPTGHTLRLLKLPAAWTGFIAENTTGTSCLGPLSGLQAQQALYESSLRTLSDPASTTLVLVSRPESSALAEADRTRAELAEMGLTNQYLFLNAVFVASDATDSAALALQHRGREALKNMPERLAALPRLEIPLLPFAPMGVSNLGRFSDRTPR